MRVMSAETWNPLEARMARLEGSYEQIDKRLGSLEGQVSELRGDIRTFRAEVETKLDGLRSSVDTKFDNLRTLMFSLVGALALLITVFEFIR